MFTQENTNGYTDSELSALNKELNERLNGVEDDEEREIITKNFNDEVSRR